MTGTGASFYHYHRRLDVDSRVSHH